MADPRTVDWTKLGSWVGIGWCFALAYFQVFHQRNVSRAWIALKIPFVSTKRFVRSPHLFHRYR